MTAARPNLFFRHDTMFGVCQAIGEDFGFDPTWLRVLLAVPVAFVPYYAFAAYGVLAVAVLASRLIAPARAATTAEIVALPAPARVEAEPPLALAA